LLWLPVLFLLVQGMTEFGLTEPSFRGCDPRYTGKLRSLRARKAVEPSNALWLLALGSSLTLQGLDARRLEGMLDGTSPRPVAVVHFGIPGPGRGMERTMPRRLRPAGTRPDIVLIEVSPAFLGPPPAAAVEFPQALTDAERAVARGYGEPAPDPDLGAALARC